MKQGFGWPRGLSEQGNAVSLPRIARRAPTPLHGPRPDSRQPLVCHPALAVQSTATSPTLPHCIPRLQSCHTR